MSEPHERLDKAMNARRLELNARWKHLAVKADITVEYLSAIRRGDYRPSDLVARRLDDAFQWRHGTVLAILDEPDERQLSGDELTEQLIEAAERVRRLKAALAEQGQIERAREILGPLVED